MYAVSGEPLSASTSGTLKPIHCEEFGSRPRFAADCTSGSANHSLRFGVVFAISRNCCSESETFVIFPTATSNQNTAPASSRTNKSPNAFRATSATRWGHSHRHSDRSRSISRWSTKNHGSIGRHFSESKSRSLELPALRFSVSGKSARRPGKPRELLRTP